jgi:holo-[acyl-carrier protein] synthase
MITGIGTDIVDIRRVEKLMAKMGAGKFAAKILSAEELKFTTPKQLDSAAYLAKRFAAKEAIAKALGTGIGKGIKFKEITIAKTPQKAPKVILSKCKNVKMHISLADEPPYAMAFAVASKA